MVERQALARRLFGMTPPAQHRARLQRQSLDRRNAVEDLEQEGLTAALDFVDLGQPLTERARHRCEDDKGGRRDSQHDQGQLPRIEQQHRQINDDREKIEKRVEQPARKEIPDVVRLLQFVGGDAGRVGMEIIDRQAQQVLDRAVGDLVIEPARDKGEQIIAQIVEAGVEQGQHPDPGAQRIKCRERLVRHHLVDEQLKEDRHRQSDQVHHQCRDDDIAHQAALGKKLGREPREAKCRVGLGRRQRGDHQCRTAPGALQILPRQEERLAVPEHRVGDRHLLRPVAPHPDQHDGVLVVEEQQDRMTERGVSQTLPIEPYAFGAQPEFPGQLDEARHRQAISLDQVAAADGADFGINPVLRAEAKETSKRSLAGDDIARSTFVGCCDAHLIQPLYKKEREWEEPRPDRAQP
jgi:hypothetical protein